MMTKIVLSVMIMVGVALLLGLILGAASVLLAVQNDPIVDQIDALLPQIQCGQCGYPGCKPYAHAIAEGKAGINQCVPGGEPTIKKLAELLSIEAMPLDPAYGIEKARSTALIDPELCIGCTLCIQACPVDAIVGAAKHMHTVVDDLCTGCELCVAPCPVDCISMEPVHWPLHQWRRPYPTFSIRLVQ